MKFWLSHTPVSRTYFYLGMYIDIIQRNVTTWHNGTTERRNGNGRTATEWWKPGIIVAMWAAIVGPCSELQLLWSKHLYAFH